MFLHRNHRSSHPNLMPTPRHPNGTSKTLCFRSHTRLQAAACDEKERTSTSLSERDSNPCSPSFLPWLLQSLCQGKLRKSKRMGKFNLHSFTHDPPKNSLHTHPHCLNTERNRAVPLLGIYRRKP